MDGDLLRRLAASEERLRLALEATGVGIWDNDLEGDTHTWSPEFRAILGLEQDAQAHRDVFAALIHPDDQGWVMERYRKAYAPGGPDHYEAEFRILRADGSPRWVMARGRIFRGADAVAVRGVGTLQDVTDRKLSELALRASEGRLRATHENAAVGIAELGADGRIKSVNEALCRITGYSRAEMLDAPNFTFVSGSAFANRDEELFSRQRAGDIASYELEKKIMTKSGEERWTHVSSTSVRTPDGAFVYAVRVVQDITELKRFSAQREMLLAELNHRVKNSLAVVLGMITQTSRNAASFEDFRAAIEGRIMALKHSYDLLSDSSWDGADLGALLQTELQAFGVGDGAHWALSGEPVHLGPRQVVPVALIVHELATNAVKHGALAAPSGKVTVDWGVDMQADGAPSLTLRWREDGGRSEPAPETASRRGFGSTLMALCIERELRGAYSVDYAPGLDAQFRFPLNVRADVEGAA